MDDSDDDDPGISLFDGSKSLEIEIESDHEEEIADQRRLDQELKTLLEHAFDDLIDDDDESSVNSSLNQDSRHQDEDENVHAGYAGFSGGEYHADQQEPHQFQQYNSPSENRKLLEDYLKRCDLAENHALAEGSGAGGDSSVSMMHYQHCELNGSADQHDGNQPINSSFENRKILEDYLKRCNLPENRALAENSGAGGDATVSMMHYQHCDLKGSGDQHDGTQSIDHSSAEPLQALYEIRVREVHRLAQQLEQYDQEKDQLLRKVALREAEKVHAQILYKQAQSLLVEHKEKISELEKQVQDLKTTVAVLEKSKDELTHQLEVSQASVMDLHSKISLLERANFNNSDKHMDTFLRNVQASHSKELKKLENQLESTATKLSKKDYDLEQLKKQMEELTRKYEALMVEKAETINQMSRSLEESQRQCQQLMGSTVSEEVVRLRVMLETAVKEKEQILNEKQTLQKELESLRMDVQQYEAIAKLGLFRPDESLDEADSIVQLGIGNHNRESGSGGIPHLADLNAKLRDELQRCLIGQKLKREEIVRLKAELTTREKNIAALQKQQGEYLTAVDKLKSEYVVLIEELNHHREIAKKSMTQKQKDEKAESVMKETIQSEFENALTSAREECAKQTKLNEQLQGEVARLTKLLEERKQETINQYSEEYLKFHDQAMQQVKQEKNREHEAIVAALRYELEDARKEADRVKEMYIKVCGSKEELVLTVQEERKAAQELKAQLKKLEAEMQAAAEAERARAIHHEANLIKLNNEKEKLEAERRSLGEVQILQQELEKERAQHEAAMSKLQEERKKLEAEREMLEDIHSLQQELEKEKANYKTAMLKLIEDRSKLEGERKTLQEVHTLQLLLEGEKAQHKTSESKLEEEKEKVKTLLQQFGEMKKQQERNISELASERVKVETLQNELKEQKNLLNELNIQHENKIKEMVKEHQAALLEMEVKAKHLYTIRVTEEIEKAKREALTELERDWVRRREEKEANRQDCSTSPIKNTANVDVERLRKELTVAFHGQVTELQLKHQVALEETSERVKDETVRFFAGKIRQLDEKHRVDLQRVEQVHKETVASLRKTLVEEHTKFVAVSLELQKVKQSLDEQNQESWRKKAEVLSQQVLETEKNLETYQTKYRAAKKTTLKYKQYIDAKEKHLNSEWHRIHLGFQQALENVHCRIESLLESKGLLTEAKMVKELHNNLDKN